MAAYKRSTPVILTIEDLSGDVMVLPALKKGRHGMAWFSKEVHITLNNLSLPSFALSKFDDHSPTNFNVNIDANGNGV